MPGCTSLLVPAEKCMPDIGHVHGKASVFALEMFDDSTPKAIYAQLGAVYKGAAPHWSQVLWCGPQTTRASLLTFFERCGTNTEVVYVMVAPNLLPRDLWDAAQDGMLQLIHGEPSAAASAGSGTGAMVGSSSRDAKKRKTVAARGPRGRLAIFFTQDCSLRRLCVDCITPRKDHSPVFTMRYAEIKFKLFVGRSGDGKSFHVKKDVAAAKGRHIITVRVNEGFTTEGMLLRLVESDGLLSALADSKPILFVFHVSAYAPFTDFDNFMFRLFVTGCLSSIHSGRVVALPPGANVHVLIEIPNPVPKHDGAVSGGSQVVKLRRSNSKGGAVTEGTVGNASDAARAAANAEDSGPAKTSAVGRCPCVECVSKVNYGEPFNETRGCAHMIPSLVCVNPEVFHVSPDVPFENSKRFELAMRMLHAFTIPLPDISRPIVCGKIRVIPGCIHTPGKCPYRYLIDSVAINNDRLKGYSTVIERKITSGASGSHSEVDTEITFNTPDLDVADVLVRALLVACHHSSVFLFSNCFHVLPALAAVLSHEVGAAH